MNLANKHCLNCNHELTGKYCSNCGQSADTSRINPKYLVEELQYGFLHINKGLLYTIIELFVRPGFSIKNYLEGKRIKYTKPIIFLILCGAVYSLIFHFFDYFPLKEFNSSDNNVLEYIPLYELYFSHYSVMLTLLIPFYALSTRLIFHKRDYNYIEHFVVFSYINGQKIAIILLLYPFIYATQSFEIYRAVHIFAEMYIIWGLAQFFRKNSWLGAIGKVLLSLALAFLMMVVIMTLAFELLKYFDIRL